MRILHVVGGLDLGGTGTWLLDLTRETNMSKYDLSFCTFTDNPGYCCGKIEELGGQVVTCIAGGNPALLYTRLSKVIAAGNYDIVHSHIHLFSGLVMAAAHHRGVSVRIAHSHTGMIEQKPGFVRAVYRAAMLRAIARHATRGIAVSEEAALSLFGRNWKRDPRWSIVHCGIDLSAYANPSERPQPGAETADAEITVGFLGRLAPVKNIGFFLRIAAEIVKSRPKAKFLIIGDGPDRETARSEAQLLGIAERTQFLGARTDVPRLLTDEIDVLCVPSHYEGLPVVLMESQAAGVPAVISDVITSEATVIPELVKRCSLSEPPSRWASAIFEAAVQPKPSRQHALEILKQSSFNISRCAETIYGIYNEDLESVAAGQRNEHVLA